MMNSGYTNLEWLQMGMFLIGMPIAALMGSLIGLFGKWNQGRVVTAAIVGLGCAALVAGVLFLTFFVVHLQTPAGQSSFLLEIFDSFFATRIAYLAIIATGAISLLAGIGLRGRGDEAGARMTRVSMRQLLLLQFFPFIALACWVGARSYALQSGGELLREQRLWLQRGWEVSGNEVKAPSGWSRYFMGNEPVEIARENAYFKEIVRIPTLRRLDLGNLTLVEEFAIEELAHAKDLDAVAIHYGGGADIDRRQLEAIGTAKSLKFLALGTTGKISGKLEPLAALPQLDTVVLSDCTVAPEAINELAKSKSLRRLYLTRLSKAPSTAPLHFPAQLDTFILGNSALMPRWNLAYIGEAKSLRALHIRHQKLTTAEIKAISACAELDQLELDEAIDGPDLETLLRLSKLRVLTITEAGAQRSPEFRSQLEKLAMLKGLVQLNCDHQLVIAPEEWSGAKPMPEIEEREARHEVWAQRVNERRKELGLPMIKVTFTQNVGPFVIGGGGGSAGGSTPAAPGEP